MKLKQLFRCFVQKVCFCPSGQFLHGRRISVADDQNQTPSPILRTKEAFYQCQWEAKLSAVEDEEERHFCMLLESLGASNVFEE